MYKNILVAVDGSETSQLALAEALMLAKELTIKLQIIHVVDETFFTTGEVWFDIDQYQAAVKEEGKIVLNKMVALAQKAEVTVESQLIEINEFYERVGGKIMAFAKASHIDLLVIGTHGRRGFRRFMLGSVAEEVIRIATMPVLLIRAKE